MRRFVLAVLACAVAISYQGLAADETKDEAKPAEKTVVVDSLAPDFQIKDSEGKVVDLKKLTAKGPVLVRLTCGCSGCDKELAYFQALHKAYEGKGLTSLAIFRMPDEKVEAYVKTFQTKTMPTNFLIEKGGKIRSIAAGCDPNGLIAKILSEKVADLLGTETVEIKKATPEEK